MTTPTTEKTATKKAAPQNGGDPTQTIPSAPQKARSGIVVPDVSKAERGEVQLATKWYQNEKSDKPLVFLPLRRSEDLRDVFKLDTEGECRVWCGVLLEPHSLSLNREPAMGEKGEIFYLFEPRQPGIAQLFARAAEGKNAVWLHCDGKVKRFFKSQNATRECWQFRAEVSMVGIEIVIPNAMQVLPTGRQVENSAPQLPVAGEDIPF